MSVFEKSLVTILVASAIFALVSIPLILRKIPPNPVYGFRTRATLTDEALWYRANSFFGQRFLFASFVSAAISVPLFRWQSLSPEACVPATVILLTAPVAIAGVLTSRFVRTLRGGSRPSTGSSPREPR